MVKAESSDFGLTSDYLTNELNMKQTPLEKRRIIIKDKKSQYQSMKQP